MTISTVDEYRVIAQLALGDLRIVSDNYLPKIVDAVFNAIDIEQLLNARTEAIPPTYGDRVVGWAGTNVGLVTGTLVQTGYETDPKFAVCRFVLRDGETEPFAVFRHTVRRAPTGGA